MIFIFFISFYLVFLPFTVSTSGTIANLLFYKLVPIVSGIYLMIYSGMRIDYIMQLFT